MTRSRALAALFLAMSVCLAASAGAQVLGPAVPAGDLDLGVMYKQLDRNVSSGNMHKKFEQDSYSVILRYGVTPVATISFELAGDQNWLGFSDDYAVYMFGVGLRATIWTYEAWSIAASAHYERMFELSHVPGHANVDEVEIDAVLAGQYELRLGHGSLVPWVGPAISYLATTPQPPYQSIDYSSDGMLGAAFGLEYSDRHTIFGAYALWVDAVEPRVFAAWRF